MRVGIYFMITSLCTFTVISCGKKAGETSADSTAVSVVHLTDGVCIYEGISLRSEPSSQKGKWLSGISLGEKVKILGETKFDSTSKIEYTRIRLLDGSEGWASSSLIIASAKPAAITNVSYFYKRPDLSTVTANSFEALDLVAVTTEQGDWLEVIGKRRKSQGIEKGWIHKGTISYDEKDVAVASMAARAMAQKDMAQRKKGLETILNNPAVSGSPLIADVQTLIGTVERIPGDYRRVRVDKAYFHDAPTEEARRDAWVIRGDEVRILNADASDWFYVQFVGPGGTTEGWIKQVDLE